MELMKIEIEKSKRNDISALLYLFKNQCVSFDEFIYSLIEKDDNKNYMIHWIKRYELMTLLLYSTLHRHYSDLLVHRSMSLLEDQGRIWTYYHTFQHIFSILLPFQLFLHHSFTLYYLKLEFLQLCSVKFLQCFSYESFSAILFSFLNFLKVPSFNQNAFSAIRWVEFLKKK